jgi:hypothetical protein
MNSSKKHLECKIISGFFFDAKSALLSGAPLAGNPTGKIFFSAGIL